MSLWPNSLTAKPAGFSENQIIHWRLQRTVQFMRSSDGDTHPGYPVHPSSADADEYRAMYLVRCPLLVRNQSLGISRRLITSQPGGVHRTFSVVLMLC